MRIAMDSVGRLVLPKTMRRELGITGPTELEAVSRDGVIELAVPDIPARVETRDGEPVIVLDGPVRPLTVEDVRVAVDGTRH